MIEDNWGQVTEKSSSNLRRSPTFVVRMNVLFPYQQVINIQQLLLKNISCLVGEMEIIFDQVTEYVWMNQSLSQWISQLIFMLLMFLAELIIHFVLQMKGTIDENIYQFCLCLGKWVQRKARNLDKEFQRLDSASKSWNNLWQLQKFYLLLSMCRKYSFNGPFD